MPGAREELIAGERQRRERIWADLIREYPGARNIPPVEVRRYGIYGGQGQGIWMDKQRVTGHVVDGGLAVGLNWSKGYDNDFEDEGRFVYSYPRTKRAGQADLVEIAATKALKPFALPAFFIDAVTDPTSRHVRLVRIEDWDDDQRAFLLRFIDNVNSLDAEPSQSEPEGFSLMKTSDDRRMVTARARPGQSVFRFRVFKRYGKRCCVCSIENDALLDAGHLCRAEAMGADHPMNGLPLCKLHHAALDAALIAINPTTLSLELLAEGETFRSLRVECTDINHLRALPHVDAMRWLYDEASRASASRARRSMNGRTARRAFEPH